MIKGKVENIEETEVKHFKGESYKSRLPCSIELRYTSSKPPIAA